MAYLDEYLAKAHYTAHVDRDEERLKKYNEKYQEIKEMLEGQYKGRIYAPFKSGSIAKKTAINWKYDLDIVLPFKRSEAGTLKEMYEEVAGYLEDLQYTDDDLSNVRRQRTSIGLFYQKGFEHLEIDVVPGRELNNEDFQEKDSEKKKLNLHWNETPQTRQSLQTNIHKQVETIKGKGDERKVIRLLKVWKLHRQLGGVKSFLLELITIKAFEDCRQSSGLWGQLKMVLEFIRDNIETVKLIDPGNSGNKVHETLSSTEKQDLKNQAIRFLEAVEEDEKRIADFIPINPKHEDGAPEITSKPAVLGAPAILTGSTGLQTQRFA